MAHNQENNYVIEIPDSDDNEIGGGCIRPQDQKPILVVASESEEYDIYEGPNSSEQKEDSIRKMTEGELRERLIELGYDDGKVQNMTRWDMVGLLKQHESADNHVIRHVNNIDLNEIQDQQYDANDDEENINEQEQSSPKIRKVYKRTNNGCPCSGLFEAMFMSVFSSEASYLKLKCCGKKRKRLNLDDEESDISEELDESASMQTDQEDMGIEMTLTKSPPTKIYTRRKSFSFGKDHKSFLIGERAYKRLKSDNQRGHNAEEPMSALYNQENNHLDEAMIVESIESEEQRLNEVIEKQSQQLQQLEKKADKVQVNPLMGQASQNSMLLQKSQIISTMYGQKQSIISSQQRVNLFSEQIEESQRKIRPNLATHRRNESKNRQRPPILSNSAIKTGHFTQHPIMLKEPNQNSKANERYVDLINDLVSDRKLIYKNIYTGNRLQKNVQHEQLTMINTDLINREKSFQREAQNKIFTLEKKLADLTSNQKSQQMLNLMSEYTNEVAEKIPLQTQDRIDISPIIEAVNPKATPVFRAPSSQVDQVVEVNDEQDSTKEAVKEQNKKIIEAQLKMKENQQTKPETPKMLLNDELFQMVQPKKNQNYLPVPQNSQIISPKKNENEFDLDEFIEKLKQPSEDTKEDLNFPSINMNLIKDQLERNKNTMEDVINGKTGILKPLTAKIRTVFGFLKKQMFVYSYDDLLDWDTFVSFNQSKLQTDSDEIAVCIVSQKIGLNLNEQVNLHFINQAKINTISFVQKNAQSKWTDSQDSQGQHEEKLVHVYQIMNGRKFECKKQTGFLFGSFKAQEATQSKGINPEDIAAPETHSEKISTSQPLLGMFAFYRYYLHQANNKYKGAILKFNMDHPLYFSKRDEIMECVEEDKMLAYWQACVLTQMCT